MKECIIPRTWFVANEWVAINKKLEEVGIDLDKPYEMTHDFDTLSNTYKQEEGE